jgi:hypothetical protein
MRGQKSDHIRLVRMEKSAEKQLEKRQRQTANVPANVRSRHLASDTFEKASGTTGLPRSGSARFIVKAFRSCSARSNINAILYCTASCRVVHCRDLFRAGLRARSHSCQLSCPPVLPAASPNFRQLSASRAATGKLADSALRTRGRGTTKEFSETKTRTTSLTS